MALSTRRAETEVQLKDGQFKVGFEGQDYGFFASLGKVDHLDQLTTAHWFDISAARRELGWSPRVRIEDGMEQLAQWVRAARPFDA